jgi:hypothetical protein
VGEATGTLSVALERCITGPLHLPPAAVRIVRTIVDGGEGCAIACSAGPRESAEARLALDQVTVFGSVSAPRLDARDSLITGAVTGSVTASGSLIDGWLRAGAARDAAALNALAASAGAAGAPRELSAAEGDARVTPGFTSRAYGDPAYAQLSLRCDPNALRGATDGAEVGAFHDAYRLQAEQNLAALIDEYLPLDLSAGVFYVT